jgi:YHS domain-containing protein
MKVDRDKAVTLTVDGQTHFFCSEHCLLAFQNDPDRRPDAG